MITRLFLFLTNYLTNQRPTIRSVHKPLNTAT